MTAKASPRLKSWALVARRTPPITAKALRVGETPSAAEPVGTPTEDWMASLRRSATSGRTAPAPITAFQTMLAPSSRMRIGQKALKLMKPRLARSRKEPITTRPAPTGRRPSRMDSTALAIPATIRITGQ